MNTWTRLEKCLLPSPEIIRWDQGKLTTERYSTQQKIAYYAKNFFTFAGLVAVSPATLAYDYWTRAPQPIITQQKPALLGAQSTVWPPAQRGFASSLFQTSGLGTKWSASPELAGKCDWDAWMDTPSHVIHEEGFDYKNFFTDILTSPDAYIDMLKKHNVTAHRFSLEWSVIEPKPGQIDTKAVNLYRHFIRKLMDAGITPSVTLSHFVVPEWFYKNGNFQNMDNIDAYVAFGMKAMELFPEVKNWWSFNELGVKAFQQAREVYPTDLPEGAPMGEKVQAVGRATRNMLIAHCKLHTQACQKHPEVTLGVTHQWLKFDVASGNILERLFRYYFEKISFKPVYEFFKDGHYSFEFPFMANIHFEIPKEEFEKNAHFLQKLGVQAYPKTMLKMGLNHGQKLPCMPGSVQNSYFTFGSTCEMGGTVMRFGPRWKPDEMEAILEEAFALTPNIAISECGSDANVYQSGTPGFRFNDAAQAQYLEGLINKISEYCITRQRKVDLFVWSDLRRQLEWENGFACKLGLIDPVVDDKRRLIGWNKTPASEYIANVYQDKASENASERVG